MGRKVALVIGNSEYEDNNLARLITPSQDVRDCPAQWKSVGGLTVLLYRSVDATEPA